jgi:hypothetical protein
MKMLHRPLGPESERLPTHRLRVFRVCPGVQVIARTLSPSYKGCFTHWSRKKSILCLGSECNPADHKTQKLWKGYALVELYDQVAAHWLPTVLEISEHLELDLRGKYKRGQVWEFSREKEQGKKVTPVMGRLLEQRDPDTFPREFSFVSVLQHLYHAETIDLSCHNPLPDRILVTHSEGAPPPQPSGESPGNLLTPQEIREALKRARVNGVFNGNGSDAS